MAFTAGIRGIAAACVLVIASVPGASADVKAFNAAMKVGDIQTAAAEAASTWATWDKADPDTALLAREFGFVSLTAGKNEQAEVFGKFLVEEGAGLKTPDDQPATSAVLYRAAQFRQKTNVEKRAALSAALVARTASPGLDMTSVVGWEALFSADWASGNWDNTIATATQAAEFMKRDEKGLLARLRAAELYASAARFIRDRGRPSTVRNDAYNGLADMHDVVAAHIDAATPAMARQLWPLKWRATAWTVAAESYIASALGKGPMVNTQVKSRDLVQPKIAQVPPDESDQPMCEGKFVGETMRYPTSKEFKGMVGAVIARFETDTDGRVIKTEVLSAVPSNAFAEGVVSTAATWRFQPAQGVDRSRCRLNTRDYIYQVAFRLG